jgi:quercetin dioxygenase-like cupin family protein
MPTITHSSIYTLPAGSGLADVWWKTGRVAVKLTGAETGGSLAQVETQDPRGTATPLHVHHNEEEAFYVLDGEVTLVADGDRIELARGDFALVPRGVPHAYLVRSEQARMLVTFSPAGFEEVFADVGVAVSTHPAPPADSVFPPVEEIAAAFASYGCEIVGPPPAL